MSSADPVVLSFIFRRHGIVPDLIRRVLKVLEELDRKRRKRFEEAFSILKKNPIPFRELDVVKLRGYENTYRIRIGDYRIIYEVPWDEKRVIIHFIGDRKPTF